LTPAITASKNWLVVAAFPVLICLAALAYSRPGYFTSESYLGSLILLELLALALWRFRQVFFALLMAAFLFAGSGVPYGSAWTSGRWFFLAIGALVGTVIALKEREFHFGFFHMVGLSCAMAAVVSAAVSRYPTLALLKALSLFLLFLYAASGARLAVEGRENRFLQGLVTGCEILVGATAVSYAVGVEVLGNPNSLGAVMGVVATPLLLWGMLVTKETFVRRRRLVLFVLCLYLVYYSHARAAMLAAAVSCGLLCVCLREYKILAQSLVALVILAAAAAVLRPQEISNSVSMFTSDVVYKGFRERGMLASRQSPWQDATDAMSTHFWFGTGFGTADSAHDSTVTTGNFASNFNVTAEYGSSYLAIVVWLGVIGALPFFLLLLLVAGKAIQTLRWMRATGSILHPAVPLALVVIAGLVHAALEDWMFAVGYYLCVFFWSMAFVLMDLAPAPARSPSLVMRPVNSLQSERQVFAPGR
jgi:hypothetical protein